MLLHILFCRLWFQILCHEQKNNFLFNREKLTNMRRAEQNHIIILKPIIIYPSINSNFLSSINWNLSYNNLYMHKKQYIYENTLNPKSTQFIFPYIKCSRIFHFLTKCFPYQNFKIIDIKFWKECISIFNI
ncbi:hypothetical protein QUC_3083 [Clostridioides difficile P50]|nr:hypothetical protein QUC_3083 [Clostridioides difficile P50]